jgi:glycosyl transferase family 87
MIHVGRACSADCPWQFIFACSREFLLTELSSLVNKNENYSNSAHKMYCGSDLVKIFLVALVVINLFLAWNARQRILQAGSDFIIYYTAAQLVRDGQAQNLYNLEVQKHFQRKLLSSIEFRDKLLPYNHPPFEVVWYLPLSRLSYLKAFLVWDLLSLLCYAAGLFLLTKNLTGTSDADFTFVWLGSAAFLPVLVTLLQGQDTAVVFLSLTLAFYSLKTSREALAGLWLSLALTKFQILAPILLLILLKKQWRVLAGFMVGAVATFLVSMTIVGMPGLKAYFRLLFEMIGWVNRYGIYPAQMHCLRGQFYALCFDNHPGLAVGLTIAVDLLLIVLLLNAWRERWDVQGPFFDLKFALLIIISLLVSPHLNFHDLSLLLLPGVLIYRSTFSGELSLAARRLLATALFLVGYPILLCTLIISNQLPIQMSVWGVLALAGVLIYYLRIMEHRKAEHEAMLGKT